MSGWFMAFLGGVTETYAKSGSGGGGSWFSSNAVGSSSLLAQKEFWSNDDNRYAPALKHPYEEWQNQWGWVSRGGR